MSPLRVLTVVLALVVPSACGGRVSGGIGTGGGGSSGGSSGGGDDVNDSGPSGACPAPATVAPGRTCDVPEVSCPSTLPGPCPSGSGGGGPLSCSCLEGLWQCETLGRECPIVETCPPSPEPGASCDVDPQVQCTSSIPVPSCYGQDAGFVDCTCQESSWSCPVSGPPTCAVDSGACPSPGSIVAGAGCDEVGADCPGDPRSCNGGQVLYDAFECKNGVWVDVARTVCEGPDE